MKTNIPLSEILFTETQRFRQWWLWLLLVIMLLCISVLCFIMLKGGVNVVSTTFSILILGYAVGQIVLFLLFRLDTFITSDGIYVRFPPLRRNYRFFGWNKISKAEVQDHRPGQFAGWGIRTSFRTEAWTVTGHTGLLLEFPDSNKKFIIGTQRGEELAAVLASIEQTKNTSI
jgi:hypothetical protein